MPPPRAFPLAVPLASAWGAAQEPVPVYFYDVPECARDAVRGLVLHGGAPPGPRGPTQPELLHLREMLQQISAVERHLERTHRVADPGRAALFLVPAYFPLLFWLDQRTDSPERAPHLACVRETVGAVERLPFVSRHMGYDHVILYGYEYPHWKRLPHLQLENYSPRLGNALLLAASLWNQGRREALLGGGLHQLGRVIEVPYFAAWDCRRAEALRTAARDVAVAFVGSLKHRPPHFVFRERLLVSAAARRPALANDTRLSLEFFAADDESRHVFARD